MPRPEGIATDMRDNRIAHQDALGRNECPDQRGLRLEPTHKSPSVFHRRNECPDQRGLRQTLLASLLERCNSRNECPDQRGLRLAEPLFNPRFGLRRNECPDQRGLRRDKILDDEAQLREPERMPRPEGIATFDDQGTIIHFLLPERMPRPEGIAT